MKPIKWRLTVEFKDSKRLTTIKDEFVEPWLNWVDGAVAIRTTGSFQLFNLSEIKSVSIKEIAWINDKNGS